MKKILFLALVLPTLIFLTGINFKPAQAAFSTSCPAGLKPGDMVKVAGKPAIYLISADSKLLYYPDGDVFKSWHTTYGGYILITQACLDSIPVPNTYPAGVNFKPGSYIVKRPSSNQLYAVSAVDTLAKISTDAATAIYGNNYKVMVIKDIFWSNYVYRGADINLTNPPATPTPTPTSTPAPAPAPTPSTGNTYYVSPTGKNTNSGSAASPWATPGYGSRKLKPGDTLIIKGGTYNLTQYDEDIIMPNSGTSDKYVTIKGEDGNRPILKGGNNLLTAIDLGGKSYVKISNIELTNNGSHFRDGLQIMSAPASHIILENLYFHHLDEYGLNIADVNDLKIYNSVFSYCGYGSMGGPAGESGGWKNVLISGTTMSYSGHYYQNQAGPGPYDRPDGFGIEASSGPIEIVNSIAEHNYGDGIDSKADNTYVHSTVIKNNSCDGLKFWGTNSVARDVLIYGRGDGNNNNTPWSDIVLQTSENKSSANFTLDRVTVDDPLGTNYLMFSQYDNPNIPTNVTITNSIFSSRGESAPIFMSPGTKFIITNSAFYFPANPGKILEQGDKIYSSTQVNSFGSGNVYGNPLFVSTAWGTNGNYRLQQSSPALGMGTNTY